MRQRLIHKTVRLLEATIMAETTRCERQLVYVTVHGSYQRDSTDHVAARPTVLFTVSIDDFASRSKVFC